MSGSSPGIEEPFDYEDIEKTKENKQLFNRKRDEIWWNFRERINPNNPSNGDILLIPPKKSLLSELSVGTYSKTSTSKIQVMSKDAMRKALKRSPNLADSIIMACAWTGDINPIELYGFSAFNIKSKKSDSFYM
jgi:hypothetical protein